MDRFLRLLPSSSHEMTVIALVPLFSPPRKPLFSTAITSLSSPLRFHVSSSSRPLFTTPDVVVTREQGKNAKLVSALLFYSSNCIGETTAFAASSLGLKNVHFPESPGLEGWVGSILEALIVHDETEKVS